jgi:hypothetical protein
MPTDSDVIESIIMKALLGMLMIGAFAILEVLQYFIMKAFTA